MPASLAHAAPVAKRSGSVCSRFLMADGWLADYLGFFAERCLSPMPKPLEQPFRLDPSDPHRMTGVMQFPARPRSYNHAVLSGDPRHLHVDGERVWAEPIQRLAAEGISPAQAVGGAIAPIKQIPSEWLGHASHLHGKFRGIAFAVCRRGTSSSENRACVGETLVRRQWSATNLHKCIVAHRATGMF
jgi:hypothetical protein